MKVRCGDANPNGNIAFYYLGGCEKELDIKDSFRCVGCGGWFHLDCILKHFELEEGHDNARNALKQIKEYTDNQYILDIVSKGLSKSKVFTEK
jgi:hypothetical protein